MKRKEVGPSRRVIDLRGKRCLSARGGLPSTEVLPASGFTSNWGCRPTNIR